MLNEFVGYAVVGVGYFGAELARLINDIDGARVVAVFDPENAESVAKELSCDVEKDLDSLCAREDVRAVIVASPNYLHLEPVLIAAKHKKHVFCEKPIALSYADCDKMVKACEQAGVAFMAGHVMNFFDGVRLAKRLIQSGKIGKPIFCHSARTGWEEPQPTVSWKKQRDKSGGHLYHHIHELDCIQYLMGAAKTATMIGGNLAHQGSGWGDEDDLLIISLEFADGECAVLEYGSAFRWSEHYLLIEGTEGAIRLDMKNTGVTVKTAEGEEKHLLHRTREEDEDRAYTYNSKRASDGAIVYGEPGNKPPMWLATIMQEELEFFNNAILGAEVTDEFRHLLTGEAARASIATADACTVSINEKRKVNISEITDK